MKFTSFLSTALLTLSLCVEYISAQSANLAPGVYQLVSVVTDTGGNRLALTDQGLNQPVVVTPLFFGQANQLWTVVASQTGNNVFNIIAPSSTNGSNLQVGPAGNLPGPLNTVGQNVIWRSIVGVSGITFTDTTIQSTTFWGIASATNGSVLNSVNITGNPLNFWVPVRVS